MSPTLELVTTLRKPLKSVCETFVFATLAFAVGATVTFSEVIGCDFAPPDFSIGIARRVSDSTEGVLCTFSVGGQQ